MEKPITEQEFYLFEKYPLTELKRLVDTAINNGADDFSITREDDGYGNKETYIKTYKR